MHRAITQAHPSADGSRAEWRRGCGEQERMEHGAFALDSMHEAERGGNQGTPAGFASLRP